MERVTITLDEQLMRELDGFMRARGYENRSEAIRDLARAGLRDADLDGPDAGKDCIAAVVYVYDHEVRELAKKLTRSFHHHHELSLATLHVHLDHDSCMEVSVLRGPRKQVRHFAEHLIAERGVRHGRVIPVPVAPEHGHRHR